MGGDTKLQAKRCQGLPTNPHKPGKEGLSYRFRREHDFANTLVSDSSPPELQDKTLLLFQVTRFVVLPTGGHLSGPGG